MKKMTICLAALICTLKAISMDKEFITVPPQETLESRLEGIGFDHFVECSEFTEMVAGKTFEKKEFIQSLETALISYKEQAFCSPTGLEQAKPKIIACFLDDTVRESK